MGVPGFNAAKCAQRNRIAALRHQLETASLRFAGGSSLGRIALSAQSLLLSEYGELPKDGEALSAINALLPDGAGALTEGDVFVHFCEAASSRFISDRYCFLDGSTLVNIAKGGAVGVAFMNSHRTGGYSTESELPFGKTFAGRYEAVMDQETGQVLERALLGFYMLQDCAPTGSAGPDTTTLDRMIRGGVLQDVSVGLTPGTAGWLQCDVCKQDYRSCDHYAGTTYTYNQQTERFGQMTEEEQEAQRERGVPSGRASYTLMDWEIGEVSGVYDGAVPGAGFSKGYDMFTAGTLPEAAAVEFAQAFGRYLTP